METLKKQPISVFHLPAGLLNALVPVDKPIEAEAANAELNELNTQSLARLQLGIEQEQEDGTLMCQTCGVTLSSAEHRQHYTTDWHRYNIKRRLILKAEPVSQAEFETLLADLTESLSGSESENESEEETLEESQGTPNDKVSTLVDKQHTELQAAQAQDSSRGTTLSPLQKKYTALTWHTAPSVYPKSFHFGVYRHVFTEKKNTLASIQQDSRRKKTWTILMMGGGHFAGAVIDVNASRISEKQVKVLAHKTFHRYTTRRKQGGSQSANDNAKGNANSAGAQIRRYNEAALQQEVRELIAKWKSYIDESEFIFVHAPSNNQKVIYGYPDAILTKDNACVKSVPFSTRRPTMSEVQRVFLELCTLKIIEIDLTALESRRQNTSKQSESEKTVQDTVETPPPVARTISVELEKLITLVKQGKTALVQSYTEKHPQLNVAAPLDDAFPDYRRFPTLLHIASFHSHPLLVSVLLRDMEADPTIKSATGKTAYELAKDKLTRNAFRRCMCDLPDKWEWRRDARVPTGLTREDELLQEAEEKQKREQEEARQQKMALEAREREEERQRKQASMESPRSQKSRPFSKAVFGGNELNMASMSPEAIKRLEREKRARAAEERMRKMNNQ